MLARLYIEVRAYRKGAMGDQYLKKDLELPFVPQIGSYLTLCLDGEDLSYEIKDVGYDTVTRMLIITLRDDTSAATDAAYGPCDVEKVSALVDRYKRNGWE